MGASADDDSPDSRGPGGSGRRGRTAAVAAMIAMRDARDKCVRKRKSRKQRGSTSASTGTGTSATGGRGGKKTGTTGPGGGGVRRGDGNGNDADAVAAEGGRCPPTKRRRKRSGGGGGGGGGAGGRPRMRMRRGGLSRANDNDAGAGVGGGAGAGSTDGDDSRSSSSSSAKSTTTSRSESSGSQSESQSESSDSGPGGGRGPKSRPPSAGAAAAEPAKMAASASTAARMANRLPPPPPSPRPHVGRAGTGRRSRQRFDPNSWSRSIPPRRTNVLCLGVSYPCVSTQLRVEDVSATVIERLHHPQPSVERCVELVRRNLLTQMDGRDLARCVALEQHRNDTLAYTASLENGATYSSRHLTANFNRPNFARECRRRFGKTIKFRQIILDYFWIPSGSWSMTHWTNSFFHTTLPSFAKEGLLDTESIRSSLTLAVGPDEVGNRANRGSSMDRGSGGERGSDEARPAKRAVVGDGEASGVVYLPFCLHCVFKVIAFYKQLSECYTISFMHKSELSEHALWHATSTINPDVMQSWLGKAINQEDTYCTIQPTEVQWAAQDSHVRKEDVLHVLRGIDDFEDVRMIRLQALRPKKNMCEGKEGTGVSDDEETEKGGFVGLKPPSEVRCGFDHLLQVQKEAAEEKKRQMMRKKVQERVLRKKKATHRRQQRQQPEPLQKQQDGSDGETDDEEEGVNWVQCDKCTKWRVVRDLDSSDNFPDRWFCEMNINDPDRNSCDAPEQTEEEMEEDDDEEEGAAGASVDSLKLGPSRNQKNPIEDGGQLSPSANEFGCCQSTGQSAIISDSELPASALEKAKAVMATIDGKLSTLCKAGSERAMGDTEYNKRTVCGDGGETTAACGDNFLPSPCAAMGRLPSMMNKSWIDDGAPQPAAGTTRVTSGDVASIAIRSCSSGKKASCQRQEEAFTSDEEASSSSLAGKGEKRFDAMGNDLLVKAARDFFSDSELVSALRLVHNLPQDATLSARKISPSSTPSTSSDGEQSTDESVVEFLYSLMRV